MALRREGSLGASAAWRRPGSSQRQRRMARRRVVGSPWLSLLILGCSARSAAAARTPELLATLPHPAALRQLKPGDALRDIHVAKRTLPFDEQLDDRGEAASRVAQHRIMSAPGPPIVMPTRDRYQQALHGTISFSHAEAARFVSLLGGESRLSDMLRQLGSDDCGEEAAKPERLPHEEANATQGAIYHVSDRSLHKSMVARAMEFDKDHLDQQDRELVFGWFVDKMVRDESQRESMVAWMDTIHARQFVQEHYGFNARQVQAIRGFLADAMQATRELKDAEKEAVRTARQFNIADLDFDYMDGTSAIMRAFAQVTAKVLLKGGTFHLQCADPIAPHLSDRVRMRFRKKAIGGMQCVEGRILGSAVKYPVLQPWVFNPMTNEIMMFGRLGEELLDWRRDVRDKDQPYRDGRAFEIKMFMGEPIVHMYETLAAGVEAAARNMNELCIGAVTLQHLGNYLVGLEAKRNLGSGAMRDKAIHIIV
mmetsp:Transcript_84290/g.243647  ORF Transcript_84290/g.243647 Transcript_84290/m.243647 type:complete len:481 (+) Transcript_84290:130-1572(+)